MNVPCRAFCVAQSSSYFESTGKCDDRRRTRGSEHDALSAGAECRWTRDLGSRYRVLGGIITPDGPAASGDEWIEPEPPHALGGLSERERLVVVLIEGFGWTDREVAELADISVSSVQSYLSRGLRELREALGVAEGA